MAENPSTPAAAPDSAELVSGLRRNWLITRGFITLMFIALGVWGLYDATIAYPARGRVSASASEHRFLGAARTAAAETNIADPAAENAKLAERIEKKQTLNAVERAKVEWFERLSRIGHLRPEYTTIPRENKYERVTDLDSRLDALTKQWGSTSAPTDHPLSAYDIPSQWLITAVGLAGGLYMLVSMFLGAAKKYRWNASTQALTLPGGGTLVPADLTEIDKRKWHKYYVTLAVSPVHPTHPGKRVELDLYRHTGLEDWVLAMEKTRFPESQKTEPAPDAPKQPETNPEQRGDAAA